MDMLQEYQYRVEHQHNDGSWSGLAEDASNNDAAGDDPERGWLDAADVPLRVMRRGHAAAVTEGRHRANARARRRI